MDKDFACWKMGGESPGYEKRKFAFMAHPYILNPATKAQALYYDNRSFTSVAPHTGIPVPVPLLHFVIRVFASCFRDLVVEF